MAQASGDGAATPSLSAQGRSASRMPVTFCFLVNWEGPASEFPAVETEFFAAIKGILGIIKRTLR